MKKAAVIFLIIFLKVNFCQAGPKLVVFAASSTVGALNEVNEAFAKTRDIKVETSYAASSTLARQIESGAPANLFIAAHLEWLDYLEDKKIITPGSRTDLLGNSLVIIAPKSSNLKVKMEPGFNLAAAFRGRLAMGDPSHVPVGIYGKEALINMGWWAGVEHRIASALDARIALTYVEREECELGILYATDAKLSDKAKVIGEFLATSHQPVIYTAAVIENNALTKQYLAFLTSYEARSIFTEYGFRFLP